MTTTYQRENRPASVRTDSEDRCAVCGAPVPASQGPTARLYCSEPCCSLARYLAAVERGLERIEFVSAEGAASTRQRLRAMANRLPVRWHGVRGKDGRFRRVTDV